MLLNSTKRERRPHAHALGVAGIDAGHQRLKHPFERLPAEPPANERGERFVCLRPIGQRQISPIRAMPPKDKPLFRKGPICPGVIAMRPSGSSRRRRPIDKGFLAGFVRVD